MNYKNLFLTIEGIFFMAIASILFFIGIQGQIADKNWTGAIQFFVGSLFMWGFAFLCFAIRG